MQCRRGPNANTFDFPRVAIGGKRGAGGREHRVSSNLVRREKTRSLVGGDFEIIQQGGRGIVLLPGRVRGLWGAIEKRLGIRRTVGGGLIWELKQKKKQR